MLYIKRLHKNLPNTVTLWTLRGDPGGLNILSIKIWTIHRLRLFKIQSSSKQGYSDFNHICYLKTTPPPMRPSKFVSCLNLKTKMYRKESINGGPPNHFPDFEEQCTIRLLKKSNRTPKALHLIYQSLLLGSCFKCISPYSMLKQYVDLPLFLWIFVHMPHTTLDLH